MKLTNRQRHATRLELSMTSMIDVVFLLLIFFLVTTTFVRPEKEIESAIRVDERDAARNPEILEPAMIDIRWVRNQALFRLGALSTGELQEIRPLLEGFENKSEGAFVRVADEVPYEAAAQAIAACRQAGFRNVSYLPLD